MAESDGVLAVEEQRRPRSVPLRGVEQRDEPAEQRRADAVHGGQRDAREHRRRGVPAQRARGRAVADRRVAGEQRGGQRAPAAGVIPPSTRAARSRPAPGRGRPPLDRGGVLEVDQRDAVAAERARCAGSRRRAAAPGAASSARRDAAPRAAARRRGLDVGARRAIDRDRAARAGRVEPRERAGACGVGACSAREARPRPCSARSRSRHPGRRAAGRAAPRARARRSARASTRGTRRPRPAPASASLPLALGAVALDLRVREHAAALVDARGGGATARRRRRPAAARNGAPSRFSSAGEPGASSRQRRRAGGRTGTARGRRRAPARDTGGGAAGTGGARSTRGAAPRNVAGDVRRRGVAVDDAQALADAVLRVHALAAPAGAVQRARPSAIVAAEQRVAARHRRVGRERRSRASIDRSSPTYTLSPSTRRVEGPAPGSRGEDGMNARRAGRDGADDRRGLADRSAARSSRPRARSSARRGS